MAVNITLCKIIGYVFAVLACLGTLGSCYMVYVAVDYHNNPRTLENGTVVKVPTASIVYHVITLVVCLATFISSVFLLIGIKNKRTQYVGQWVFVMPVGLLLTLLKFMDASQSLATNIVSIVLQVACWYPIFKLYREMRASHSGHDIGYNAVRQPGGVYATQAQPAYAAKN